MASISRMAPGSSPLARGLLRTSSTSHFLKGIIPARAGFTLRHAHHGALEGDHPRSRGVYRRRSRGRRRRGGSSPLARGLPGRTDRPGERRRIIPARAGFTGDLDTRPSDGSDHPRSRGVYTGALTRQSTKAGSSPLARGLRPRSITCPTSYRIIPARAGFTTSGGVWAGRGWDHPRSRGVYYFWRSLGRERMGSSPLARGLLEERGGVGAPQGIIPARAGFTPLRRAGSVGSWDHPRSRGVYRASTGPRTARGGSSPLARGLPLYPYFHTPTRGIIPARAGFTKATLLSGRADTDHPRSRGVY